MARLFIGCSGFSYAHWRDKFYPQDLPQSGWFKHYCSVFSTVELNVTFYRLVKPENFQHWRQDSPPDFVFSVKGSRYVTHIKRLTEVEAPLERFFEGVLHLENKLAAVLWQLPPGFSRDMSRLQNFLVALKHYSVRNVFEFRHESWHNQAVYDACRKSGACICMADSPDFNRDLPVTTDFVYIRRHGKHGGYTDSYSSEDLNRDAQRISSYLQQGHDVYIYFNNDAEAHAVENARELMRILGSGSVPDGSGGN